MPINQSACRQGHSTETAILKIYNDIVNATANGRVALLCLYDLSAAFNSVDVTSLYNALQHPMDKGYGPLLASELSVTTTCQLQV